MHTHTDAGQAVKHTPHAQMLTHRRTHALTLRKQNRTQVFDGAVTRGGKCALARANGCILFYVTTAAESQLLQLPEHAYFSGDTPLEFGFMQYMYLTGAISPKKDLGPI